MSNRTETWVCENDRYCGSAEEFSSAEEFEAMVRECFADECDGFDLFYCEDRFGRPVYRDEYGEIALTLVETA